MRIDKADGKTAMAMRRHKPDLLALLALLVALGVLFTGITQAMMRDTPPASVAQSQQK